MALHLQVKFDTSALERKLKAARKQIPFATLTALNDVAFQVQKVEAAAIPQVLHNPRPFTRRSVLVDKASKASLSATVRIRPEVARYLEPYEDGGVHVLPGAALLDPKGVNLDQYGQITRQTLARLKGRPDVFVGTVYGVTGFWQRLPIPSAVVTRGRVRKLMGQGLPRDYAQQLASQRLKLLIRFGDALPVHQHLQFHDRALAMVSEGLDDAIGRAVAKALKTAS